MVGCDGLEKRVQLTRFNISRAVLSSSSVDKGLAASESIVHTLYFRGSMRWATDVGPSGRSFRKGSGLFVRRQLSLPIAATPEMLLSQLFGVADCCSSS